MSKCFPFLEKLRITNPFGSTENKQIYADGFHHGLDMIGIGNIDVVSCSGGVVKKVVYGHASFGNHVWVLNDDSSVMLYAHLDYISVSKDQRIECKTKIGVMGATGNVTGAHLHLGLTYDQEYSYSTSEWVNPALWFGISDIANLDNKEFDCKGYLSSIPSMQSLSLDISDEKYQVNKLSATTSDWLFGRRYRILIGLGEGQTLDVSDLRCVFNIVKTTTSSQNVATVSIYNLSPETEGKLIREGQTVVIEAGYNGSQYGVIYKGEIIQPLRSKENSVDYVLTLVCMESYRFITDGIISTTISANQTLRDAISACQNKSGEITETNYSISQGVISNTNLQYPRGKVMFGRPNFYLDGIAKTTNSSFYIDGDEFNIVAADELADDEIFDLSSDSGLIGTPTQTADGITCECLLNPKIKLSSMFHIKNDKIKAYQYTPGAVIRSLDSEGIYRVIEFTHKGDTRGQNWLTSIKAVSQSGRLPSSLLGNASIL